MKLRLSQLLKNASKWVFKQIEKSGEAINAADEKIIESMFKDKDEAFRQYVNDLNKDRS
jgi:hypothetical protein